MSLASNLLTPETMAAHRATWYVYAGGYGQPTERIRHTAGMRGSWAGWDVECSCGEGSHTGGAIKARVQEWLFDHRHGAQVEAELHAEARADGIDPADLSAYVRWLRDKLATEQEITAIVEAAGE